MIPEGGILLVDKPTATTSFRLVAATRHLLKIQKVGHAGTLDPLATGLMVLLVGRHYTKMAQHLILDDKEYKATLLLGVATDSGDSDGVVTATSTLLPTLSTIDSAVAEFQGWQQQTPPMFSAKKIGGKKLYELARRGIEIPRPSATVFMAIDIIDYREPFLELYVKCSKGTYIRSLANDLGEALGCHAHLHALRRCRSGGFSVEECLDGTLLCNKTLTAEEVRSRLLSVSGIIAVPYSTTVSWTRPVS